MTAAGENIDNLANFVVAPEDRINFSRFSVGREVDGELIQILLFPGRGNPGGALRKTSQVVRSSGADATNAR